MNATLTAVDQLPRKGPDPPTPDLVRARRPSLAIVLTVTALFAAAIFWSFWPTLAELVERWAIDPQYSHGFLVPLFAALILWVRRPTEKMGAVEPLGLALLIVALIPRWYAGRMDLGAIDSLCLLGAIAGTALFIGGRPLLAWTWVPILFLGFMIPLPFAIEEGVAMPLRRFATEAATYLLQTLGYPAVAEGNVIRIDQVRLGVIEACSGLGMLMTLLAIAVALALILKGPVVDRVILVLSAVPVAVVLNMLRITLTGVAYSSFGWQQYHQLIHDVLGYFMCVMALIVLWTEHRYLQRLFVPVATAEALDVPLTPWLTTETRKKEEGRSGIPSLVRFLFPPSRH